MSHRPHPLDLHPLVLSVVVFDCWLNHLFPHYCPANTIINGLLLTVWIPKLWNVLPPSSCCECALWWVSHPSRSELFASGNTNRFELWKVQRAQVAPACAVYQPNGVPGMNEILEWDLSTEGGSFQHWQWPRLWSSVLLLLEASCIFGMIRIEWFQSFGNLVARHDQARILQVPSP